MKLIPDVMANCVILIMSEALSWRLCEKWMPPTRGGFISVLRSGLLHFPAFTIVDKSQTSKVPSRGWGISGRSSVEAWVTLSPPPSESTCWSRPDPSSAWSRLLCQLVRQIKASKAPSSLIRPSSPFKRQYGSNRRLHKAFRICHSDGNADSPGRCHRLFEKQ